MHLDSNRTEEPWNLQ